MLLGIGGGLLLAGLGLLFVALFHWLEPIWGRAGSFAAIGLLCCLAAGGVALWSYRWLR
ncbi:MAG TPA: hypothetical protein VK979_04885 [Guyparkeria sp.]|nr:hypothetical protein [Guyparkeria sp.]